MKPATNTNITPTDKQLTDLWLLIDDYTGETTVGERMRRAWDFVSLENGNSLWLSQAHNLCTLLVIDQGHIDDRMFEAISKVLVMTKWASESETADSSFSRGYEAARRWVRDVQMIRNV